MLSAPTILTIEEVTWDAIKCDVKEIKTNMQMQEKVNSEKNNNLNRKRAS